ncbi:putative angiopoietin-related protein 7 [Apostichopus japonicus]|uniref:Putative angiopoietin-related protein 7 n=1 Tax=Stichopus japonicus TaxID=307972 RepID=A0A2G8LC26_STIJA|nr:putative angiopoietin-related protein 7 [Apostichopus japonicus]
MTHLASFIFVAFIAVSHTASVMETSPEEPELSNFISREFEPIMYIYDEGDAPVDQEVDSDAVDPQVNAKVVMEDFEVPQELIDKAKNATIPDDIDFEKIANEYGDDLKKFKENFVHITENATSTTSKSYTDCQKLFEDGKRYNGVYEILPSRSLNAFNVSCDFTTDPGYGWTNIMRRTHGDLFFYQNWNLYRNGFGGLGFDHWLGLDKIKYLANQRPSTLRIDLYDCNGQHRFAEYDYFALGNVDTDYELLLGVYSAGDAGDSLSFHRYQPFSTYDRDNDAFSGNCASLYKAGWWYNDCYESNLNGLYFECSTPPPGHTGITWKTFGGFSSSLERVEMKVRPKD